MPLSPPVFCEQGGGGCERGKGVGLMLGSGDRRVCDRVCDCVCVRARVREHAMGEVPAGTGKQGGGEGEGPGSRLTASAFADLQLVATAGLP